MGSRFSTWFLVVASSLLAAMLMVRVLDLRNPSQCPNFDCTMPVLSNVIGETPESHPEPNQRDGKDMAIAAMEARIESLETQLTAKDQQINYTTCWLRPP